MVVLSTNDVKYRMEEINSRPNEFTVLDTKHIKYQYNSDKFRLALELLNICNTVNYGNKIIIKLNPGEEIPLNVFYKAIDACLKDRPFTEEELVEYFKQKQQIEEFAKMWGDFSDLFDGNLWFPEVDILLLGITLKEQEDIGNSNKSDLMDDYAGAYDELFTERFNNDQQIKEAIKKAKSIIKKSMKQKDIAA